MPHDQNTGGFFVALLRKHHDFEWKYGNEQAAKMKEGEEPEAREEEFLQNNLPEVEEAVAKEDQFEPNKVEGHESDNEGENEEKVELEEKPERVEGGMKEEAVEEQLDKV